MPALGSCWARPDAALLLPYNHQHLPAPAEPVPITPRRALEQFLPRSSFCPSTKGEQRLETPRSVYPVLSAEP